MALPAQSGVLTELCHIVAAAFRPIEIGFNRRLTIPAKELRFLNQLLLASGKADVDRAPEDSEFIKEVRNNPEFRAWARRNSGKFPVGSKDLLASFRMEPKGQPSPIDSPQEWNLSFDDLSTEIKGTDIWPLNISEYDRKVLQMKKGDTVHFRDWDPDRPFVLGDYLGAGNSCLVFALAEEGDLVIKIPFSAMDHRHDDLANAQNSAKNWPNHLLVKGEIRSLGGIIPARMKHELADYDLDVEPLRKLGVKIKEDKIKGGKNGQYYFVVQERAHGTLAAREFLEYLARTPPELLNPNDVEKRKKWERVAWAILTAKPNLDLGSFPERQFIWDERDHDWVLVDR